MEGPDDDVTIAKVYVLCFIILEKAYCRHNNRQILCFKFNLVTSYTQRDFQKYPKSVK